MNTRTALAVALLALLAGCGGGSSAPATPSSSTPVALVTLSGVVFDSIQGTLATVSGARVEVTAGVNTGRSAMTDAAGRYRLDGLSLGAMTLRISAAGFFTVTRSVTIGADLSSDFGLVRDSLTTTSGRVVDAVSQAGVGGVTISGSSISSTVSDPTGSFLVGSPIGTGDPLTAVFSEPSVVERQTGLRVPGRDATVSLIPGSFDLRAFNEMFRVSMLLRWTTPPPLLVETRAAQFTTVGAADVTAVNDEMSDAEYAGLVDDLTWALPQLTGGTFGGFASVARQTSIPGNNIHVLNTGVITVVREVGLTAGSGFWGYSRWQFQSDGTIISGMVTIDRDFDRSTSPFRRSLRAHEFGHALGYNHVTSRVSVMNSDARTEPTAWDRDACVIGFQRSPGNRTPDIDPVGYSPNRFGLTATWSPPIR
jgi:hypothetical protein